MFSAAQLLQVLPKNYASECAKLCNIKRWRGIKCPEDLMLLSLFHLLNGCTLIEISQIAKSAKIADISDVAFMDRFALCSEWFKSICAQLAPGFVADYKKPEYLNNYRAVAFDASDVVEKGRSGRTFRLHYGIDIFTLSAVSHKITDNKTGEKIDNFTLSIGDIAIADRAYGTINSVKYCLESGADFIFRLRTNCFSLYDENQAKIDILSKISHLEAGQTFEIAVFTSKDSGAIPIRLCIRKKDEVACINAKKRLRRTSLRKGTKLSQKTEMFNEYIVLATSLPDSVSHEDVLDTYRCRWQVENYFKRIKSLMNFGDLPKKREASSLAWLNGKLMIALLIETLIGKFLFSPAEQSYAKHLA